MHRAWAGRSFWLGREPYIGAAREGKIVKRIASNERAQTWVVDYSAARARAIGWLGDRYLLARPINASESAWRKALRTLLDSARVAAGSAERTS